MIPIFRIGTAFFAGALALVSQIAVLRLAIGELSASALAIAVVLVSSLVGLSLGSVIIGQIADRVKNQNVFAFSITALAATLTIATAVAGFHCAAALRELQLPLPLEVTGFVFLTNFPVNFLLGGIIPTLTRASVSGASTNVHRSFGTIYSVETFGAAVGSMAMTFVAIPSIGMSIFWLTSGLIVLGWSLLAFVMGRRTEAKVMANEVTANPEPKPETLIDPSNNFLDSAESLSPALRWMFLLAALLCSCASLGMELIWQRCLAIVFGSDTHSYAVVATVFLIGLSIGASLTAHLIRHTFGTVRLYANILLMLGISILASMWILKSGLELESMRTVLQWLSASPMSARLLVASTVLLLPAILVGMALPILVKLWVGAESPVGASSGQLYAVVIAGNVLGIIVCAVWLIPNLGLQLTSIVLAFVCFLVAGSLLFVRRARDANPSTQWLQRGFVAVAYSIGIGLAMFLSNSHFRPGLSDEDDWIVEHYSEQANHTVAVVRSANESNHRRLLIDGVTIGELGSGVDEKQQFLAHLPFLIGDAQRASVLTIGLGTGILASELASVEQVDSITCVELSSAVIEAAGFFSDANRNVLVNEKLNLVHGDGVRYLRSAAMKFDAIVSDGKSRPGSASNIPFFSREYYQLCSGALSENGVFVQWVSLRSDRGELETILKTFARAFPYGHVAVANPGSVYLVGSRQPIRFQPAPMNDYLQSDVAKRLNAYGWADADDFLSLYWLDHKVVEKALNDVPLNNFDRPVLETYAWDSFKYSVVEKNTQLDAIIDLYDADEDALFNGVPLKEIETFQPGARLKSARRASRLLLQSDLLVQGSKKNWLDQAADKCKDALQYLPNLHRQKRIASFYRELATQAATDQDPSKEFSCLANLSELRYTTPADEYRMATILQQKNAHDLALDHLYRAVKLSKGAPKYRLALGEGYLRIRKFARALEQFDLADASLPAPKIVFSNVESIKPRAELLKGIALVRMGRGDEGQALIARVLKDHPELQTLYYSYSF